MQIIRRIKLDFARESHTVKIFAKQGDINSRYVEIEPLENGLRYQIPDGVIARFAAKKPDGTEIFNDYPTISENIITVVLTEQTLAAAGDVECDIQLYQEESGQVLKAQTFVIRVRPDVLKNAKSSNEYQSYEAALLRIEESKLQAVEAVEAAKNALTEAEAALAKVDEAQVAYDQMMDDFGNLGGIAVSEEEPTNPRLHAYINPKRGNPISVVTAEDIAQELGDDPEKVLSQKAATELALKMEHSIVNYGDNLFDVNSNKNLPTTMVNHIGYSEQTSCMVTHPILMVGGMSYKWKHYTGLGANVCVGVCDINGNYVGYEQGESNGDYLIFTPSKTGYFRVNTKNNAFNGEFMVFLAEKNLESFIPFAKELDSSIDIPSETRLKYLPFYGKNIVNFGDSIFGNYQYPVDISTFIAEKTGATVYNCGFGGCRMGRHIRTVAEGETVWDAFSMYRLADAITTGNFERQDDALSNTEWTDKPDYFDNTIDLLKSIDFSKVDIITIAYGTNDFTGENALDDSENPTNTKTYGGALRYSVETILSVFPHIRIFVLSPTYRFWLANGTFDVDSNTKTNGRNNTLIDFVEMAKKIANEYCVSFIDNYYELGFNKFNRTIYFPTTDGTHPNETGRKLIADHIVAKLF